MSLSEDFRNSTEKLKLQSDPILPPQFKPESLRADRVEQSGGRVMTVYQDEKRNEYFEITGRPASQMFCAQLLKGIFNVSDIVAIKNNQITGDLSFRTDIDGNGIRYFSKRLLPNDIDQILTIEQIRVDRVILEYVFHEGDFGVQLLTSGRISYFDFEEFSSFFWGEGLEGDTYTLPDEIDKTYLESKLKALEHRFEGSHGVEFFHEVLRSLPVEPSVLHSSEVSGTTTVILSHFQQVILRRIQALRALAR